MQPVNLAALVLQHRSQSDRLALAIPPATGDLGAAVQVTYGQLLRRIDELRGGIERSGLRPGDRVVMLSPLSPDFFALALALLASGQVLVFLDGRLDKRRALAVLKAAQPRAIVSVRQVLRLWPIVPAFWGKKRIVTDASSAGRAFGTTPIEALIAADTPPRDAVLQPPHHSALLSFTSGTTGNPKGADRTHGILLSQHLALAAHVPDRSRDIDMPCFPAVVLHNLSLGISTVLPPIDLRHPGAADPARVAQAIDRFGVNSISGAPAFMGRLADHLAARGGQRVLRALVGGAPVSRPLARRLIAAFPGAALDAVYGSTEAEPMTHVGLHELAETPGDGYLVGTPAPVADLRLVDLPELAPPLSAAGLTPFVVPSGVEGEVVVRGPHVNQTYVGDPDAVRRYKVPDPDGTLWHRTGDTARQDPQGRYWLTGRVPDRVSHRGQTVSAYVVEARLAEAIAERAAFVAHAGAPEGELAVEVPPARAAEVLAAARTVLDGLGLGAAPRRAVPEIPVDARHNSKIDRPTLRTLLAGQKALP